MTKARRITFLLLLGLAVLPFHVAGQEVADSAQTVTRPLLVQTAREDERVTAARRLMREKNYEAAAALLETLNESDPNNDVVANLLRASLQQIKQYDKAIVITKRQVAKDPENHNLRIALAELLVDNNQVQPGLAQYDSAITILIQQGDYAPHFALRSLIEHGQYEKSVSVIRDLRKQFNSPLLYAYEEGNVLEHTRNYKAAVMAYLPLAFGDSTTLGRDAERRLLSMLEYPETSVQVETVLKEVSRAKTESALRITDWLTQYYLRAGRYDEAFASALRQDSLSTSGKGAELLGFIRFCRDRRAYPPMAKMAALYRVKYPETPYKYEVAIAEAEATAALGKSSEAITLYKQVTASPAPQVRADAYYSLAMLYLDQLNDPTTALSFLDSSQQASKNGMTALNVTRAAPICLARIGNFTDARKVWTSISEQSLPDDIVEEAFYSVALLDLFEMHVDSAIAGFKRLVVKFPRGFYVNDCLAYMSVLTDAKDSPELLALYADAERFMYQHRYDSTAARLEGLVSASDNKLAPLGRYKLAQLALARIDSTGALSQTEQLLNDYPESSFVPYALKLKGDLLLATPGKRQDALEVYRTLLSSHPNFPYASEVRKKLRELSESS